MGAEAAGRLNGPWAYNVQFPKVFSETITPENPGDISDNVVILTAPTPVYGGIIGGLPAGVIVKDQSSFRSATLPVFEWTGYESSPFSLGPLNDQRYFALTRKFRGEAYRTKRITIGKVALTDEVVACAMPVKKSRFAKPEYREAVVSREDTLEFSVGKAVLGIINGTSEHKLGYDDVRNEHYLRRVTEIAKAKQSLKDVLWNFQE